MGRSHSPGDLAMLARFQPSFRPISLPNAARIDAMLTSSRAKYVLAQLFMVTGYLALIFNPLEGDGMLIGMICQGVALLVYCWSKQSASDEKTTRTIR
jgi:hypothetical protein